MGPQLEVEVVEVDEGQEDVGPGEPREEVLLVLLEEAGADRASQAAGLRGERGFGQSRGQLPCPKFYHLLWGFQDIPAQFKFSLPKVQLSKNFK